MSENAIGMVVSLLVALIIGPALGIVMRMLNAPLWVALPVFLWAEVVFGLAWHKRVENGRIR